MKADDNDKLWELLGKTRQPNVSPFFARNILRTVRQEEETRSPLSFPRVFGSRIRRFMRRGSWSPAIIGTCAIAVCVTMATIFPGAPGTFVRHHHTADSQFGLAKQIVGNPDYETIQHLDELVADEESSLWLDDSTHSVH